MENNTKQGLVDAQISSMPAEVNEYALFNFKHSDPKSTPNFQRIIFYKLNPDGSYENGTTLEELLKVGIKRLQDLNSRYFCRENDLAITKMEEALMWLNKRTEDRKNRGVEGQLLA